MRTDAIGTKSHARSSMPSRNSSNHVISGGTGDTPSAVLYPSRANAAIWSTESRAPRYGYTLRSRKSSMLGRLVASPRFVNRFSTFALCGTSTSATTTFSSSRPATCLHLRDCFWQMRHPGACNLTNHTPVVCPVDAWVACSKVLSVSLTTSPSYTKRGFRFISSSVSIAFNWSGTLEETCAWVCSRAPCAATVWGSVCITSSRRARPHALYCHLELDESTLWSFMFARLHLRSKRSD
mmetsp:Transcript_5576/g.9624  ORF Transcript_5576/g.9624 Transcript_5576/m.9624 type:complete len:238 (+) Transcript_5576:238-951(+)